DIAQKTVAAGALDGGAGEHGAEPGIVEPCKLGETRRRQFHPRQKRRFMPGLGKLVPRAPRETIVAAEDAVADKRTQFVRDRPLVLDRQIRDAAPRIELI